MNKTALYEMWTALVAVFHVPGDHPRPVGNDIYNIVPVQHF
jgi:hypothetical protein